MNRGKKELGVYSKKFNIMLKLISHPDGGPWTGTKMERATSGQVISSYFSSLKDGHIDIPRADKIQVIALAMGFPPELWFKDLSWWEETYDRWLNGEQVQSAFSGEPAEEDRQARMVRLVNRLFEVKLDEITGQPLTNEAVAELSGGVLEVADVEGIRSGRFSDPTWRQVLALCDVFEVSYTYFAGPEVSWFPSPAVLDAATDGDSYLTFRNSRSLGKYARTLLRSISEELRRQGAKEKEEDDGGGDR